MPICAGLRLRARLAGCACSYANCWSRQYADAEIGKARTAAPKCREGWAGSPAARSSPKEQGPSSRKPCVKFKSPQHRLDATLALSMVLSLRSISIAIRAPFSSGRCAHRSNCPGHSRAGRLDSSMLRPLEMALEGAGRRPGCNRRRYFRTSSR